MWPWSNGKLCTIQNGNKVSMNKATLMTFFLVMVGVATHMVFTIRVQGRHSSTRLAKHFPRQRARPFWELYAPSPSTLGAPMWSPRCRFWCALQVASIQILYDCMLPDSLSSEYKQSISDIARQNFIAFLAHNTFTVPLQMVNYSGHGWLGNHQYSLKWPPHCGEHSQFCCWWDSRL